MLKCFKESSMLFLLILLLNLAASQNLDDSALDGHRKRTVDPVSNFFSELGELFLDVDQTIAVQSRPKIEYETNVASQLFRPSSDYFDRIQQNYKDMQKRLGNLIGNTIGFKNTYSDHELSTVNPPLENVPTIKPDYNPFAAAAEARKEKLKQRISKGSHESLKKDSVEHFEPKVSISETIDESLKAFSKLSKSIIDNVGDLSRKRPSKSSGDKTLTPEKRVGSIDIQEECSNEVLEDPDLEKRRQEKCSRIAAEERAREDLKKLMLEPKRATEALLSKSSEALEKLTKSIGRSGDFKVEHDLSEIVGNSGSEADISRAVTVDECSGEVLEDASLESIRREKCNRITAEEKLIKELSKLFKGTIRGNKKYIPVDYKGTDDLSSVFIKRSGDADDQSTSDILSDSSLDKQIRQIIKDHGSWILDYPLLKRWRQRDESSSNDESPSVPEEIELSTLESTTDFVETEPTELYVPVSTDYEMALQNSGETGPEHPKESSYYRIVNEDGDAIEEEVDIVLRPESRSNDINIEIGRSEPRETVILAFTSDGVPLKLRMGPEIDNPLKYLHKALNSAGVSLNIPVDSYDDLEPVGREVLKLGSGILTRAVLINASNANELKALLKALMASKSSGKTIF